MEPTILAIETSCDETAASVVKGGKVLNNIIATQFVHENYGGVVPELASREHQRNIVPVVDQTLKNAAVSMKGLNAIAFTQGPGLMGSLLVGTSFAKSAALSLGIPIITVHHMQAHILAHFIEAPYPSFPFLCLTISGGHTQIVRVDDYLKMTILGQTQDDAVGEAFDKGAKIMGLPYPGGPMVDSWAAKGNSNAFTFPTSDMPGLDFSFSGIKTSLLYFLKEKLKSEKQFIENNLADICASYQATLIKMLIERLGKASKQTGINEIAIAGGVSANNGLRNELKRIADEKDWMVHYPKLEYCTDNAAMIAMTAHFKYLEDQFADMAVSADPKLKFPENERYISQR